MHESKETPSEAPVGIALDHHFTALLMTKKVKKFFEGGYGGTVTYEKGGDGTTADLMFFDMLIYKSIRKHLDEGNLPPGKDDPPRLTEEAAKDHGKALKTLQPSGDLTFLNIMTTFYKVKAVRCGTRDSVSALGFVCDF